MSRLSFAMGGFWAAAMIEHDHCTVTVPAANSPTGYRPPTAYGCRGPALFSRLTTSVEQGPVMCDINITPLIDVMLVLLVTLIITLPITTHAVKLDLAQTPSSILKTPPEVIN